jgi:hypothetical protein
MLPLGFLFLRQTLAFSHYFIFIFAERNFFSNRTSGFTGRIFPYSKTTFSYKMLPLGLGGKESGFATPF